MKLKEFTEKIEQTKKKLKAQCKRRGLSENFGQKEIRKLTDIYAAEFFVNPGRDQVKASDRLTQFWDWCVDYEGEK